MFCIGPCARIQLEVEFLQRQTEEEGNERGGETTKLASVRTKPFKKIHPRNALGPALAFNDAHESAGVKNATRNPGKNSGGSTRQKTAPSERAPPTDAMFWKQGNWDESRKSASNIKSLSRSCHPTSTRRRRRERFARSRLGLGDQIKVSEIFGIREKTCG